MAEETAAEGSEWLDGIAYRIWLTSQFVGRRFTDLVEDLGATVTQVGLTVHLAERGPLSASDLARMLGITPQGASKALGQLEVLGWVSRAAHPAHGRIVLFEITDAGRSVAARGRRTAAIANREIEAQLEGFDLTTLQAALTAVRAGLNGADRDD